MIKLINLDKEVRTLNEIPILDFTGKKNLTYRSALISVAEMHKPSTPGSGEALKAFNLGMKLVQAKEILELEQEELNFLKEVVDKSSILISVIIGRLNEYLAKIPESKVDSSK